MNELIKRSFKNAKKELLKTGTIRMKVFMTDQDGDTTVLIFPDVQDDSFGKNLIAAVVRKHVREMGIKEITFVSDCWFSTITKDMEENLRKVRKVSEDPNRQEAIVVSYEDMEGNKNAVMQGYRRLMNGKIVFDKKITDIPDFEGRFAGFFENLDETTMSIDDAA